MKKIIILTLTIFFVLSCTKKTVKKHNSGKTADNITFSLEEDGTYLTCGDSINFSINVKTEVAYDSFLLYVNNIKVKKYLQPGVFQLSSSSFCVGEINLKLKSFLNEGKNVENDYTKFTLLSDIDPNKLNWKVIRKIPHSRTSYTQGLFLLNDTLFESTGQWSQSKLFKLSPQTGKVYFSTKIEDRYFGEGITIVGDNIFQITYKAGEAFIYDKNTFERKYTFNYTNAEGWGLTTINNTIIMSDGSEKLFWRNSSDFTVEKVIEVYDNKGPVFRLNELEYIKGTIFANIYGTNKIAQIDTLTGKVLSYLDMSGILNPEDKHPGIDVLNGIAFDEKTGELIITGKNWPYIYYIEVN